MVAPRPDPSSPHFLRRPARGPGRYHRQGEPGVRYASSQEQAARAELFRHSVDDGIDPFELRRRVGRVSVDLDVLDLTNPAVREHLAIDENDLLTDNNTITQEPAAAAPGRPPPTHPPPRTSA